MKNLMYRYSFLNLLNNAATKQHNYNTRLASNLNFVGPKSSTNDGIHIYTFKFISSKI